MIAVRELRWIGIGVALLALLYAALPVVLLVDRGQLERYVLRERPGLGPSELGTARAAVILFIAVVHAGFLGLEVWLAIMIRRPRLWARRLFTVVLIMATVGSLASWSAVPEFAPVIIATGLLQLAVLALLWLPRSMRRHFAEAATGRS